MVLVLELVYVLERCFKKPIPENTSTAGAEHERRGSGEDKERLLFMQKIEQIHAVRIAAERGDETPQTGVVDEAHAPGDFLGTADLEPLPLLDGFDERGSLQQRLVRPGVQPGGAAAEDVHGQRAVGEIGEIQIRDLQLAAGRRRAGSDM